MSELPVGLGALDPDQDPRAGERFVEGVMARVATIATPRSPQLDALVGAWSLAPAFWAAISLVAVAALAGIFPAPPRVPAPRTVAEAIGVPRSVLAVAEPTPGGSR